MTTTPVRPRRAWQAWTLAAIQLFVAYQAISGGIGLISNTWGMPSQWLVRTPFTTWTGPGWILITLVAIPHVVAAIPALALPGRPRLGVLAGVLAGASLLVWIAVQLALLQQFFFLQPIIAAIGLLQLGVAWSWRRRLTRPGVSDPTRVAAFQA
ncbi:MAG TPA: hypothetical protein VFW55_06740 [Propionicimonas sp.]|nr:hypothetical protein [Propionicimonas sp.]